MNSLSTMPRRVVITGSGAITPFGDLGQSVAAIRAGRSVVSPVRAFDASVFSESRGGQCTDFDARPWFRNPKTLKIADRRTRFAVAAAGMAFAESGLDAMAADEVGVVIGTNGHDIQVGDVGRALGPLAIGDDVLDIDYFGQRILRKLPPLWLLVNLPNMASAHVAIQLGAHGPNSTITTDWIAGLQAIGEAARWIAAGEAELVVAGGADSGILPLLYATLEEEGFFHDGDPGFVPGEGAAVFVLEERAHALERGARILGEVTGYACSSGPGALQRTMEHATRESPSGSIDLICEAALFAGTHREDEERAIREVFPHPPARFECNSLAGFAMAAAAPIALAIAMKSAPTQSILINSLGAFGQAACLTMITGEAA